MSIGFCRRCGRDVRAPCGEECGRDVRAPEFDKIGFAGHTEPIRHQHHAGYIPFIASFEIGRLIDFFVRVHAFGSVLVILPDLFDQMQGQSAFAEQQVVQVTQWQQFIVKKLRRIGQSRISKCERGTRFPSTVSVERFDDFLNDKVDIDCHNPGFRQRQRSHDSRSSRSCGSNSFQSEAARGPGGRESMNTSRLVAD